MVGDDDDAVVVARLVGDRRELDSVLVGCCATCGSWYETSAPAFCSSEMSFSAGDSRMSPMSGLYATPSTRIREPFIALLRVVVERLRDERAAEVRHLLVDLAGELDELRVEAELARLPREVERIDRDAVAAEARARG